jgi:drug/metabolite transporter (DMT)-like permease
LNGTLKAFAAAPTWALLAGAATWGVVWYPYRLLAQAGMDGIWSTVATYGIALTAGLIAFPRAAASLRRISPLAVLMGLAVGWSNLAYVLGVLEGEVMRVLLLFYLAPLWTVPLARVILGERLDAAGLGVMALAFGGAMIMLWRPEAGVPWPSSRAEWLGLVAGILFALGNVLVRRIQDLGDAAKSIVICAGVTIAGLVHLPQSPLSAHRAFDAIAANAGWVAGIGVALFGMSLALQYGLSRLAANRAIVILLFELVVAAIAAYLLAGETMGVRDWVGGLLIVAASIAGGWVESRRPRVAVLTCE